jgi:hypothetical protein
MGFRILSVIHAAGTEAAICVKAAQEHAEAARVKDEQHKTE